MKETLVARIEIDDRNAASIIRIVTDGVYICKCSVRYNEYKFKTKHAFFYDCHFKPFHQIKCCGYLIDNIADAPICVL